MAKPIPFVDDHKCNRCSLCTAQRACRLRALVRIDSEDAPFVDAARCYGCLRCIVACTYGAVVRDALGSRLQGASPSRW